MLETDGLTVARTIADVRETVRAWREAGHTIALVPTMGWLHAGHLALIERARERCERVLATIFVNPLQFAPTEDFAAYPRGEERDFALLRDARAAGVFAPDAREMFPDGGTSLAENGTRVSVPKLADALCGLGRPGHFDGVATIVTKLLQIAQPDVAFFGEKDYQQLAIIRRMVRDLSVPVEIVGVPTVREADGLALSSRNVYLTPAERAIAPRLQQTLCAVRAAIATPTADVAAICADASARLVAAGFASVEYLTLASGATLATLTHDAPDARLFVAARLGRTRLIDNIPTHAGQSPTP